MSRTYKDRRDIRDTHPRGFQPSKMSTADRIRLYPKWSGIAKHQPDFDGFDGFEMMDEFPSFTMYRMETSR